MTRLHYLRDKALADALRLFGSANLLRQELGTVYGSLMTAGDLKDIAHQRAEAGALMDTCIDFARYMGTPEAWAEVKQTPAEAVTGLLAAIGPSGEPLMSSYGVREVKEGKA